jgi:hypothetical protein
MSTATLPFGNDLIRLIRLSKAYGLHQRRASTGMQLVHTEEVTGSIPGSPTHPATSHELAVRCFIVGH